VRKIKQELKLVFLILGLVLYLTFIIIHFTSADPVGAEVNYISNSTYTSVIESRSDPGGYIITINLAVTQQEPSWKGYVGNITGMLVLRNSDGWSIYEWGMNSTSMSGFVFVSRNDSVDWTNVECANDTNIISEQNFFGMSSSDPYSINNTFNASLHSAMDMSGPSNIAANSCQSTATYVNDTAQTVDSNAYFQELTLYDRTDGNFIFATFIEQDAWGFNNNASMDNTYDFQIIVAENTSISFGTPGTTYYFYADIS